MFFLLPLKKQKGTKQQKHKFEKTKQCLYILTNTNKNTVFIFFCLKTTKQNNKTMFNLSQQTKQTNTQFFICPYKQQIQQTNISYSLENQNKKKCDNPL